MDAFITRRGGAGGGLNFKVVGGTTQPSNPKENTIWVNTDQEITGWGFGTESDKPETPDEGMVWFVTTNDNIIKFNALKDDTIIVTPIAAYQYVSDAWESIVDVKIYQGGEWVDWWDGSLYNAGDQYERITGGWVGYAYGPASSGSTRRDPTIVYGNDTITISNGNVQAGSIFTENKIDLSGANSIRISVTARSGSAGTIALVVTNAKADNYSEIAAIHLDSIQDYDLPIDLDGEYYVVILVAGSSAKSITFSSVKLLR